jgi:putative aldouronate transport system substrate-binding protein
MEMYEWKVDLTLPPLFMPQDVAAEIAELETALSDTVRQATAQFIYGARDINSDVEWNKYVDDLDRLGLDRLMELFQVEYLKNYGD